MIVIQMLLFVLLIVINEGAFHVYYRDNKFNKPSLLSHLGYGIGVASSTILTNLIEYDINIHKVIVLLVAIWSFILYNMSSSVFKSRDLPELEPEEITLYHMTSICGSIIISFISRYYYY